MKFLDIIEPLPDPSLREDIKSAIRHDLYASNRATRTLLTNYWENQYKEGRDDLGNIRSRAATLLSAAGIVSGVLAFGVPLAAWFRGPLRVSSVFTVVAAAVVLALLASVLWSAFAAVYLSVRAQEAHDWWCVEVCLDPEKDETDYELEYAFQLNVGWQENATQVDHYEQCLSDAQNYFRILVGALVLLVAIASIGTLFGSAPAATIK